MPSEAERTFRPTEQEEIQQLFGRPPGWFFQWGIVVVAVFVALLIGVAAVVPVPEVLKAEVVLVTGRPPLQLTAPAGGVLSELWVAEGDSVFTGQVLAVWDNPAIPDDVFRLQQWLGDAGRHPDQILILPVYRQLGAVQPEYAALAADWAKWQYWLTNDDTGRRVAGIERQLERHETMEDALQSQIATLKEEVAMAQKNDEQYDLLRKKGAASELEADAAHLSYLRSRRELEQLESQLTTLVLEKDRLQEGKSNLIFERTREKEEDKQRALSSLTRTLASVDQWRQKYCLLAPQGGRISFPAPVHPHQYFEGGEAVMAIVPTASEGLSAEGTLAVAAVGKLKPGAPARIQIAEYPSIEFGELPGNLRQISETSNGDKTYKIILELPSGAVTTYHKTLEIRPNMHGTALVEAGRRTLLARLFDRLRAASTR